MPRFNRTDNCFELHPHFQQKGELLLELSAILIAWILAAFAGVCLMFAEASKAFRANDLRFFSDHTKITLPSVPTL
jgi:hypothetical protein